MNNIQTSETENHGSLLDGEFFKHIPQYNPGLVAIVRAGDMKMFFVNKPFEYYLGYTNHDLASDNELFFSDIIEGHQSDQLASQLSYVDDDIASQSGYVIYKLKHKNGSRVPFYLYVAPIKDDHKKGKLYYFLLHPDLSKWGMPFTSMDSKELFLEQFNSEDFGTYEWIMENNKLFWSSGLYRLYEVDDTLQIDIEYANSLIHPADLERVKEATRKCIESGGDLNIEYRIITARQNMKEIQCLARVIKTNAHNPIKLAGSIRDITAQKQIGYDLENKVKELNLSNKELEEFAYVASHDLQEPLRKISTFSDRLSEKYKDVLTGDGAMYLSRINASAANMRSLIDNLLEFSKISRTGQHFDTVNLNLIIHQAKSDLELVIEETGTVINAVKLPTINAVSSQMKQLFVNLIGNAIKFHKQDVAPVITIECELFEEPDKQKHDLSPKKTYYKIQVTDNGIGFEEEYATRIFQVFQRLHGKSEYPGSGIGLAICKKILEYHGGTIYAENVPGIGARFVMILPENQIRP